MIKLKFYLRKEIKTKDGLHPVYMDISYNGNRIRKPVQHLKVKGNHWLLKQQRIRKPSKEESYNFFEEYNLKLDELANTIGEIKKSVLIHNHQLSDRFILDRLENPNKIQVDKRQFFAIVKEYLEQSRSIKSKNTLKGAVSTFNFLEKFQSEKNHKLNLQEINQQFFEKLRRYAFEEKNIGDNYFAKIIASLKTFLSWSQELGYHSNTSYKKFKAVERETEVIYLTMEELFHLYRFPLSSRKLSH
ncbi:MAG: phage integrase SAM-like domain-containing protein, partial [Bacteroidota bacterium]